MKLEAILYIVLLILGSIVARAPWTFVPDCMIEMRCWDTRTVETILGAVIAVASLVGVFKSLE
ncbi:MAG: DUF4418 family protein [Candidatus Thorarchaeota archaeon]|nr:DUF4418 family protein [Candidatus Thorarchaeota archaeon]